MRNAPPAALGPSLPPLVFLISASVLGFEISLMRVLLLASWHHFAFVVISIALLGFGASGTALTVLRPLVMRRPRTTLLVTVLATAVAMPVCAAASQLVAVEARFVPSLLWSHLGQWVLFWCTLTVPFLFGAAAIGAALMVAGERIALVYGSNLIGSAVGAVAAPLAMTVVEPAWLPVVMAGPAAAAAWTLPVRPRLLRAAAPACAATVVALALAAVPPGVRTDPYKYGAYLERLERQGAATRVARLLGPRSVVDAYRSDVVHDLPFLGVGLAPPPVSPLLVDGHRAGSVLSVAGAAEAAVVDRTLMAFAHDLASPAPRVALLGETDGTGVWLALRRAASAVDVVQGDPNVVAMLRGPLRDLGGHVLDQPGVRTIVTEPHHFVRATNERYDVIQLASLQGSAAGSGGVAGLGQDHLLTVDGLAAALGRLTPGGLLFACRGIQTPPRDNLKLLATFTRALRRRGVGDPGRYIVVVRDYLAVCTIVRTTPWTRTEIDAVRRLGRERELTPVWFEGIRDDELNHPDALPVPPTGAGDWYHHAAVRLFASPASARHFVDEWPYDVRPPLDDRPYFHDYCRLGAIKLLRDAFGDQWLTRIELAYLFVLATAVVVTALGVLLILAPLPLLSARAPSPARTATAIYFGAIGLAYLVLEMTFLARLPPLVGDPVLAASLTIGGVLLFSGAGSLAAQRIARAPGRRLPLLLLLLVVVAGVDLLLIPVASARAGAWPALARCIAALVLVAPSGLLMGFPMPLALARLERGAPALIPWAWGVNGFASVLAAPVAVIIAMTWGLLAAGAAAVALYALAAAVANRLPDA